VQTDNTPPVVSHTIPARVEATDTITVRALDPSGIAWIGFRWTRCSRRPPFTGSRRRGSIGQRGRGNLTDVTRKPASAWRRSPRR